MEGDFCSGRSGEREEIEHRKANSERRTAKGEQRKAKGKERRAKGERRRAKGERQTANGKRQKGHKILTLEVDINRRKSKKMIKGNLTDSFLNLEDSFEEKIVSFFSLPLWSSTTKK